MSETKTVFTSATDHDIAAPNLGSPHGTELTLQPDVVLGRVSAYIKTS